MQGYHDDGCYDEFSVTNMSKFKWALVKVEEMRLSFFVQIGKYASNVKVAIWIEIKTDDIALA